MLNNKIFHRWCALLGLVAVAIAPLPALALDINGYSTPGDGACWLDPACSLARGGHSDMMTVLNPDGTVYQRIFAFGNEENNNGYYFDPTLVFVNPAMVAFYRTLLEPDGVTISDQFGIGTLPSGIQVLGFLSDENNFFPPLQSLTFVETPDQPNLVPEPGGDSAYFTVPYNATMYLDQSMQQAGFTAYFRSDVDEPSIPALLGVGALSAFFARRRKAPLKSSER
ncbi:MAG TPA: hypothetical protein VMV91_12275 [Rhodocyclaceae bacterium]|uniref:hypothetical protein n=1 Tax=Sulfuricella sp. TaxID=2099377 RepID=UPI002CBB7278|nr:hypothetical protein [Sulfuricella sp.]HUW38099.1 hypothetical protein [Rhodocyclaceae bacterium]HUX62931.1 hypothetical protein [Sulfuricella sp.]